MALSNVARLFAESTLASQQGVAQSFAPTVYVNPKLGIITSGRGPSLDEAKAQFLTNWAEVPHRLDSARALFYLIRPCRVCVRVPCRRGLFRRAFLRPPHSRPPVRFGCTKLNGMASG